MSGPNINSNNAPLPIPVNASAQATVDSRAQATQEDGSSADTPFAAVLERQLVHQAAVQPSRSQPSLDPLTKDDVAKTELQGESATDLGNLATLLPFLLNGTQTTKSERPQAVEADTPLGSDPSPALLIPAQLAVVTTSVTTKEGLDTIAGNNLPNVPAPTLSPAILAGSELEPAAMLTTEAGPASFDNLLASARDSAQLALGHSFPQSAANRPVSPELAVQTPVAAPGWDAEVGSKLVWMAGRQESRAELILTPPQLGRIEVSLTVSGDQATATFVSASPAVREALENALPRLREVLAEAGVALGQTQVGAQSSGQQPNEQQQNRDNPTHGNIHAEDIGPSAAAGGNEPPQWLRSGRALVDVFA